MMRWVSKVKSKWDAVPLTVKVSTSYAICSIFQRCLSFITLPLFTRILTEEQYGQYTIYSSWSGILSIFLTLNLAYGSFPTAMVKYERQRDAYIASVQGICLLLSALFLIIYLPFSRYWNALFELPTYLVLLMVFEILCNSAILFWSGKKQFEYKYKGVIGLTVIVSVCSPVAAFLLICNSEEKGYARIIGYACVTILIGGFVYISNLIKGKKLYQREFWKYAFSFNVPLLVYYLSQVVFNQSDRIMISHISGKGNAAFYGVAYNLATVLAFVLNAVNNAYIPWFYARLKDGRQEENKQVSCGIALLMAVLLLGIIWFAPEIILVIAGKKYCNAVWVVPPVAMSLLLLFYAQLFINVEFFYEEKKLLVGASVGAALINIGLNALCIPVWGYVAAGYTTLVSYIIFAAANYFAMKKVLEKRGLAENAYDIKKLLGIFAGFAACGFAGVALYAHLVMRILAACVFLFILLYFQKRIWNLIGQLRR